MPNNQFKKGELYSFITGKASTAIARRLQKKLNASGLNITIEQWSVLYHLWKQEGISQQELCNATFRDKPSITRLVDNLEKLNLVKRVPSETDRRINLIYLTKQGQKLEEETMQMADQTLNEALDELPEEQKQVFILNELEGVPFKIIAEQTGETLNTLISRKRYAVLHLRQRLQVLRDELLNY